MGCLRATVLAAPLFNITKQTKKNLVLWELRPVAVPKIKHCIDTKVGIKIGYFIVEPFVANSVSSLVIN